MAVLNQTLHGIKMEEFLMVQKDQRYYLKDKKMFLKNTCTCITSPDRHSQLKTKKLLC